MSFSKLVSLSSPSPSPLSHTSISSLSQQREAVIIVASASSVVIPSCLFTCRGGGGGGGGRVMMTTTTTSSKHNTTIQNDNLLSRVTSKLFGSTGITPQGKAVLYMAIAMSIHFAGYEFARNTSLTLFTSTTLGFGGGGSSGKLSTSSMLSLTMACVTPFSMLLLIWYGEELELHGPRIALYRTTTWCAIVIALGGIAIHVMEQLNIGIMTTFRSSSISPIKIIVWCMYLLQNSYCHLLYQQHWSFIGSILTPREAKKWFASITGLTSITSTIAASLVGKLSKQHVSLPLLFGLGTGLSLLLSSWLGDKAYQIADIHGFTPHKENSKTTKNKDSAGDKNNNGKPKNNKTSTTSLLQQQRDTISTLLQKTSHLFERVPPLKYLFWEVISFMALATSLNLCLVKVLKTTFPIDAERSAWTSQFWAYVNGFSGILQFFVLPTLFTHVEPRHVFVGLSCLFLGTMIYQTCQSQPSLGLISGIFLLAKVSDYAIRGVVSELVYVSLDYESRYLGKEMIGVFGNRLGKSGISLLLTMISTFYHKFIIHDISNGADVDLPLQVMSLMALGASLCWCITTIQLSRSIRPSSTTTTTNDNQSSTTKEKGQKEKIR